LRRGTREGSEDWRRGIGPPREMIEDLFDHRRIFDRVKAQIRTTAFGKSMPLVTCGRIGSIVVSKSERYGTEIAPCEIKGLTVL